MNASLRRENPKQCSFLCLIYVNHESFHKWNKRYCERLVLPDRAHPGSPTQSIPRLTASATTREHGPRRFFLSHYFSFNCQCAPCATVHTVRETSSQVMPAIHCQICSRLQQHITHQHMRGREREAARLHELFQETKGEDLWAALLSKNFLSVTVSTFPCTVKSSYA